MTATFDAQLVAFLARESAEPFLPGRTDCARTADRWAATVLGFSPMARFGRVHGDEAEMRAWLAEPGGIAVAVNRVMRCAGLTKTTGPKPGDIGLVVHRDRLCVAIHAGQVWFSRDESGLIGAPLDAAWKAWKLT